MRIKHEHVHHHLTEADSRIGDILERIIKMSAQMDALVAQVEATKTVTDSAITLLNGLRQQIIDAGVDQAKLTELTDSLKTETDELAEAVSANTPATPTP
jgi:hypothetical protein